MQIINLKKIIIFTVLFDAFDTDSCEIFHRMCTANALFAIITCNIILPLFNFGFTSHRLLGH